MIFLMVSFGLNILANNARQKHIIKWIKFLFEKKIRNMNDDDDDS